MLGTVRKMEVKTENDQKLATVSESTQVVRELINETRRLKEKQKEPMPEISAEEREEIREEFVACAERLVLKYRLTIPQARRKLHEILDVSV
jgi:hypothetical protein